MKFAYLYILTGLLFGTGLTQTAIPVLGISPSPYLNGLGGAGVALPTSDPFVIFANPAQLAANIHSNGVSAHFYPAKAALSNEATADLRASAATVGYRIPFRANQTGFKVAIGYLNTDLDLGTQIVRDQSGNEIARSISSEYYYGITLSFAFEYKIMVGFGVTYKWVTSERGFLQRPNGTLARLREDMGVFDYGVIAALPIYNLIFEHGRSFSPFFDISAGYSKINLGSDVTYNGEIDPLPLPKTGRLGYAFSAGLDMQFRGTGLNLVTAEWTGEKLDPVKKTGGVADNSDPIFIDTIAGDNRLPGINKIQALHIGLFETISYQQGIYSGTESGEKTSRGFGITTSGLFKLIRPKYTRNIFSFIIEQMEFRYYQSWYYASADVETVFYGVNIRVGGF